MAYYIDETYTEGNRVPGENCSSQVLIDLKVLRTLQDKWKKAADADVYNSYGYDASEDIDTLLADAKPALGAGQLVASTQPYIMWDDEGVCWPELGDSDYHVWVTEK